VVSPEGTIIKQKLKGRPSVQITPNCDNVHDVVWTLAHLRAQLI